MRCRSESNIWGMQHKLLYLATRAYFASRSQGQEWPEDITQALGDRLPRIDKTGDNGTWSLHSIS